MSRTFILAALLAFFLAPLAISALPLLQGRDGAESLLELDRRATCPTDRQFIYIGSHSASQPFDYAIFKLGFEMSQNASSKIMVHPSTKKFILFDGSPEQSAFYPYAFKFKPAAFTALGFTVWPASRLCHIRVTYKGPDIPLYELRKQLQAVPKTRIDH